jgi:hypothetical protein
MSDDFMRAQTKAVFEDLERHIAHDAVDPYQTVQRVKGDGTSIPPGDLIAALDYFIAQRALHWRNFRGLQDYAKRKLYEAINGHKDFFNGTPIASWAQRAVHDRQMLVNTLKSAHDLVG